MSWFSSSRVDTFSKQIPSNWILPWRVENALVKPLLKKLGLALVFPSFRPVSNLPFISKLTEKASVNQLSDHMNKVRPLPSGQSAYRPCHSTETALLKVQSDILLSMDDQKVTLLVMLDLTSAQHSTQSTTVSYWKPYVPVLVLVEQLWNGSPHIFLKVQIKGTLSGKKQLTTGVPEGSCLGPVLFTIYVADLFQIIEKHLPEAQGYADDHQVYRSFRPIPSTNQTASVTAIENCVAELRSWMISNMLIVNDSKTEFLIVGSKQQLERVNIPFIHVGGDQITPVTSVRNVGVIFDSNLKMDMQITKACQNAYYHLHNIRRNRKSLSQESMCMVIHAFITSQIDYCNSLMNGLLENLIKKFQRVQNTAARLVFNLRKYDRITLALVTLQWLPVKYRIEFQTLLIVFKGRHGKAPTYI